MTAWFIEEFTHFLRLMGETWSNTPGPVRTIIIAAFGTLVGAFLTSRSQAKRRVIEELRAIHAAYTITFATVNKALAIKRQHIRPMKESYEADLAIYEAWMVQPAGPLNVGLDLRTLSKLRFAAVALERTVFEKCSLGHKGLAAALSLLDATDDVKPDLCEVHSSRRRDVCLMAKKGWSRPFEDPIPLPDGRELLTLKNAADYIMKLPKVEQNHERWQTAVEVLIMAAEGRGPLMHARIGVLQPCTGTSSAYSPTAKTIIGGSGSWRANADARMSEGYGPSLGESWGRME